MNFKEALQVNDPDFNDILKILKLRRDKEEIEAARNILLVVNHVVEYYLNRDDDTLKIPIVYFPICNDNIQEICEQFVCIKFGLYSNTNQKKYICTQLNHRNLYVPENVNTPRKIQLLRENFSYENNLSEILSKTEDKYYGYGNTLLYSSNICEAYQSYIKANKSYSNTTVNKYWSLGKIVASLSTYKNLHCPLAVMSLEEDLYDYLIKGKDQFENIVLFPMKSADGRYSDFCAETFQKPYLDDYISSGVGLKNVFVFCFSKKPFRLRRLFDFKLRMKERFQSFENDFIDFITFSYQESLELTGKSTESILEITLGKDEDDKIQQDYEALLDATTNSLDSLTLRRNEMSLCISEPSILNCISNLVDDTEISEELFGEIFTINGKLWNKDVDLPLRHFLYDDSVFVVTANYISDVYKINFENYLKTTYNAKNVSFGTFQDLRGQQINNTYKNVITENKILVMSFRNDYTESMFHKYPNSFDPFCINEGQKIMIISNYLFMRSNYEWGKYKYNRSVKHVIQSEFRNKMMKPTLPDLKRPINNLLEDTYDEENDRNTRKNNQPIKVSFSNGTSSSYAKSEWMLYEYNGRRGILPLSDIVDMYDSVKGISIQPMMPLVKEVLSFRLVSNVDHDKQSEKLFKEQPSYGLSPEEIASDTQLWKILLKKKMEASSEEKVYDEVMSHFFGNDIISFNSFKKWVEPDYGIPRARKMQKYLIEDFLGIRPPYINLIRRIKERTKNDTEAINIKIRHFLNLTLLCEDYGVVMSKIDDSTKDLLEISKVEDIKEIITRVKEVINLKSIKQFSL